MRILDVSPRPSPVPTRGSDVRILALLRALSEHREIRHFAQMTLEDAPCAGPPRVLQPTPGWTQWIWSHPLADRVGAVPVEAWPRAPLWAGRGLALARPRELERWLHEADVVLVEFPWQYAWCRARHPRGRFVYASHNVEVQKFASWARAVGVDPAGDSWMARIERMEAAAVHGCERIVAVSDEDADGFVERYGVARERVHVVPNGADTERLRPASAAERSAARARLGLPERPSVWFGAADVPPNRAALTWVEAVAARVPEMTFLVTGRIGAQVRPAPNIVVTGELDAVDPALAASDLALVPIEFGGGTKIKLLEALAAGLPSVVFRECLHGLDLEAGVLCAVRDAAALAAALRRLRDERGLAAQLSEAGRKAVVERYGWRALARRLDDLLDSV